MRSATTTSLVSPEKDFQAGFVVFVILKKGRQENRRIEEEFHGSWLRTSDSRSFRTWRRTFSVAEADNGSPLLKTQTPCFFRSWACPRSGRKVISSPVLSISSESPGSRRNSSRNGFGRTTRPA